MLLEEKRARKDGGVQAPIGLGAMFHIPDSDDEDVQPDDFENTYEVQELNVGDQAIKVRQYSWHEANANQVWPGTFALASFIKNSGQRYHDKCLELGSATGALAIYLRMTGDIDDNGVVAENILHNEHLNLLEPGVHIPHTWGTGWAGSLDRLPEGVRGQLQQYLPFKFVIASDILLYVSAYPALVTTLKELFATPGGGGAVEFLMAWNRRIAASGTFFDMMRSEGFHCHHHGHCIYSFFTDSGAAADPYLASLLASGVGVPAPAVPV